MKEIKFRAWNAKKNVMANVIELYWWKMVKGLCKVDYSPIFIFNDELWLKEDTILMQCTGLKDKNGVEIFEGDYVKKRYGVGYESNHYPSFPSGTTRNTTFEVKWDEDFRGYRELSSPLDMNFFLDFEVIGDIYRNPEIKTA
jgi:uncharacterized phage protein (TIGR01671 family)